MTTSTRVPLPDGSAIDADLARPAGDGPHAALLVLHEIFGLNDDMRRITDHLAEMGYVALAPDLYSGGGPRAVCLTRVLTDVAFAQGRGTLARLDAGLAHLGGLEGVDPDRLGVIGFCMGGGFAMAMAARGGVKVASVNYGQVPKKLDASCPVVASFGATDRVFASHAARLESHLAALGVDHDVKLYPGVGHSFMSKDNQPAWAARLPNPMNVGHDEAAAADSWTRISAFFERHLGPVETAR